MRKLLQILSQVIYIIPIAWLIGACTTDNADQQDKKVVITTTIDDYVPAANAPTGIMDEGDESTINNLYVFLFPTTSSQSLIKYYITNSSFTGGAWDDSNGKINLELTQAEAGNRLVYLVANCAQVKADLDDVTVVEDLDDIVFSTAQPWSATLTTPIMMVGHTTHNFMNNYQLSTVNLERVWAKIALNITLGSNFQATPNINAGLIAEYQYRYIDFDKKTYLLKPTAKTDDLVSSTWINWASADATLTSGKVSKLSLVTYLNERDNDGAIIEIKLPFEYEGMLPPPEFGDETYIFPLPDKIERNHWYVFDNEISM